MNRNFLAAIAFASASLAQAADSNAPTSKPLVIYADRAEASISRNIYGQFSEHLGHCVYEGLWVGEDSPIPNTRGIRNDVVAALKKIQVPVLRWPGGCFADEYHWKDGLGPPAQRPSMVNTHWAVLRRIITSAHTSSWTFNTTSAPTSLPP
jgi:hypothetical protein